MAVRPITQTNNSAVQLPATSLLSDQVVNAYYATTAGRGHIQSRDYYENAARDLSLKFEAWLPKNNEATCLDLACGCGEFLYLLEKKGLQSTTGVDLCNEELEQARSFIKGKLIHTDVLSYLSEASAESFDFISALNLLEHLSKDALLAVLTECQRVLKPGGTLVAMVPNAISPFGTVTRYWDITHEWAFTTNNFRQLAALVGFGSEVEFCECGPKVHGVKSALRYGLWQILRAAIAAWLLIELGTTKDRIYSMDMLVRMRKPE